MASAYGIALEEGFVYATQAFDTGGVVRVSKDGGKAEVLATGQGRPYYLALDSTSVYFTATITSQVMRVDKNGAGLGEVASFQHFPAGILARPDGLFWLYDSFPSGALMVLLPGATEPAVVVDVLSPTVLRQRGDSLFLLSHGQGATMPSVLRFDLPTATLTTVAETTLEANDLAVGDTDLFYTTNVGAYRVRPAELPEVIGTGVFVDGITVAGGEVYFTERGVSGDGRIQRWSATSGQTIALASKRNAPRRIAVDESCVYWTEGQPGGGAGAIVRAPR